MSKPRHRSVAVFIFFFDSRHSGNAEEASGFVMASTPTECHDMAKQPKQLDELFHDTLKDIYYAEKKILAALPKMAKAAQNEALSAAFEKHHGETEEQVSRLEQVLEPTEEKPQGKKCDASEGIHEE